MKIFVARHGESTGDIEDRYGGDYDDFLTEKGLLGAEELGKEFFGKGIQVIFSSPRKRALQAAKIVGKILDVEVKVIDDLREWNRYGVLTGMTKKEAREACPDQVSLVGEFSHNTVKGSESYEDLKQRILKIFNQLSNQDYKTALVISHGGVIKCFAKECLDVLVVRYHDYGYFEVDVENGRYSFIDRVRYDIEAGAELSSKRISSVQLP